MEVVAESTQSLSMYSYFNLCDVLTHFFCLDNFFVGIGDINAPPNSDDKVRGSSPISNCAKLSWQMRFSGGPKEENGKHLLFLLSYIYLR
jgi:hypothetical protein